jgi:hypothetical protein
MWATMTLLAAVSLTPGQAGGLQMTNDRVTYGLLGPTRTEKVFLPGDILFLSFDIEGLAKQEGRIRYSMKLEILDSKGEAKFSGSQEERTFFDVLGANRIPGFAHAVLGLDTAPGDYTMQLTITDLLTKKNEKLVRKFTVAPKDFGLVGVSLTYDTRLPAPTQVVVGQPLVLTFGLVGFERDAKTRQPHLKLDIQIIDEAGKPTLEKPIGQEIVKEEEKTSVLPGAFDLALTRAGKFTIELKATDVISKKSASVLLPFTILEGTKKEP